MSSTSNKKIFIISNETNESNNIKASFEKKLSDAGFETSDVPKTADLIVCIGGDGTLLQLMQTYQFPTVPVAGIHTGHLGFFQDVTTDGIDDLIKCFNSGDYTIQPYNIAKAVIQHDGKETVIRALNEFAITSPARHSIRLSLSINNSFIENFYGDGILVATPAGSTGYNYSLGGCIVDPRLNVFQVTPMAPMNTVAYRSLTSSILLPQSDKLIITPDRNSDKSTLLSVYYDGVNNIFENVESITFTLSKRRINLLRTSDSTFWNVVKDKFL